MKKIIILVVLVLLLGGGGVAVMSALGQGPFAELWKKQFGEKAPPPPPPPLPAAVYDLGSYTIPLIDKHNISRQVGMDIEIEVDGKISEKVNQELPRLQNAFTVELFDLVPRHPNTHSAADKKAIHDRLLSLATKIYGEGMIHDVVIKSMSDR